MRILNLSKNQLGKEGAKVVAEILKKYRAIEHFDISFNKIGNSGCEAISKALVGDKTLRYLNMYGNIIDVVGSMHLAKFIASSPTLEFLDIGYNRVRDKGMQYIIDGITENKACKLQVMGLKYNFLSDGIVVELMEACRNGKVPLHELYLKNNSIDDFGLKKLKAYYDKTGSKAFIDLFDKFKYITEERLARSVWLFPVVDHTKQVQLLKDQGCGIILSSRVRKGKVWPNRRKSENKFLFVEFGHEKSAVKALKIVGNKQNICQGIHFKIFRAGSSTYVYCKSRKNKALAKSETLVFDVTKRGRTSGS